MSGGLDVLSTIVLMRRLPEEILLRPKLSDARMFESILHEAEKGVMPDALWTDGVSTIERAEREFARRMITRSGNNRSEAARRLGVDRTTVIRHAEDSH